MEAILTAAGSCLGKVVKTTVHLIDLIDFPGVNVYEEFLGDVKPARATVQVTRLPLDARIEIEAVALIWIPCRGMAGFREKDLCGFLHFAGSQASGADANPLNGAVFHDAHALKIGVEFPRTHIVRV